MLQLREDVPDVFPLLLLVLLDSIDFGVDDLNLVGVVRDVRGFTLGQTTALLLGSHSFLPKGYVTSRLAVFFNFRVNH